MMVVIPTWAEVNGWMALLAIGLAFVVYVWLRAKKEERSVTWIRDWNEPNTREEW